MRLFAAAPYVRSSVVDTCSLRAHPLLCSHGEVSTHRTRHKQLNEELEKIVHTLRDRDWHVSNRGRVQTVQKTLSCDECSFDMRCTHKQLGCVCVRCGKQLRAVDVLFSKSFTDLQHLSVISQTLHRHTYRICCSPSMVSCNNPSDKTPRQ